MVVPHKYATLYTMSNELEREAYSFAMTAVMEAGAIARSYFGSVKTEYKESDVPYDVVTEADRTIESLLATQIRARFPEHGIHSEEGADKRGAEYVWTIDPIDGTSNFARNIPHFSICLGLLFQGEPVVGVVFNPITDECFSFQKGQGAWCNGVSLTPKPATALEASTVLLTVGSREGEWNWGLTMYKHLLEARARVRNLGSSALDFCFLAAGRVDAVIYAGVSLYDIAPAVGIVREMGGAIELFDTGSNAPLAPGPEKVVGAQTPELRALVRSL